MGTVTYMSPEQLRGQKVDARADIFSLGVVLYEVIAGRSPFAGSTQADRIAAILEREPEPLSDYRSDVPRDLERIVSRALRKDRDARYQLVEAILVELNELKQELEIQKKLGRSTHPELRDPATKNLEAAQTEQQTDSATTSSTRIILSEIKRHRRGALLIGAAFIAGTIALGYFFYSFYTGGSTARITSLAVLPFTNTGNAPNLEYLCDGISEALINSLTDLQQLRVIARSTAFRYKGKDVDPNEVGRNLNVGAVLMGRVSQLGDALDIQVDLVDTSTGAQLWGEKYERKVSDALSIKQAIAHLVTEKLRLRLTGEDERQLVRRDTTNADAYQAYLRGRYYWNKRTADGLNKAIEQFQQALDRDPNFALAYAGLADCYVLMEEYAGVPSSECMPKARAAVDRALQIDGSLAEARTTSALIYENEWRWTEAEAEFKHAISLNPNYPTAHHWLSIYYQIRRQFDDELREIELAQGLDPLSPIIGENVSEAYILKNDFDSAIEQSRKALELDPNFAYSHRNIGYAYLGQRRNEAATAEFQKAVELSKRASEDLGALGYCYAITGRRDGALAILKELDERYARRESLGIYLAIVNAGLGDKDQAFAWLEKDFQQRSSVLAYITWWFPLEDLRSDSRYDDLVRRMGLSP
jgi:TolB-like protein/Tfp pilus assembly protein PilF